MTRAKKSSLASKNAAPKSAVSKASSSKVSSSKASSSKASSSKASSSKTSSSKASSSKASSKASSSKASSSKASSSKAASTKASPAKASSSKASSSKASKSPWIAEVAARLALARSLCEAGFTDASAYTPRDSMSAESIAAFEATHGIELPTDYRDLIEHLGVGIGPDSGLLPLGVYAPTEMPSRTVTITSRDSSITASAGTGPRPSLGRAASMAKPFPLNAAYEVGTALPIADDEHLYDGCIEIGDLGCGYTRLLAITGPVANLVWEDTTAAYADGALYPIAPFRTWFDTWLDESIAWLASSVARSAAAASSKAILKSALRQIEPTCLDEPRLLACLAYVKLALGDREAALALLDQVPVEHVSALRSAIYAKDIEAASRDKPALQHATHTAREVRLALAANPATPALVIEVLATDADSEVRSRAARHANAAPAVIERVAREGLATITRGELGVETAMLMELVVRSPNATRELVDEVATVTLAGSGSWAVRPDVGSLATTNAGSEADADAGSEANAGSSAGVSSDTSSRSTSQRACAVILRGVALSPMCSAAMRSQLARSEWPEVRHAVAACRETSEAGVRLLARDSNVAVRTAIAARRDAPIDVLLELSRETDGHLRNVLAANPRTPPAALVELARHDDSLYGLGKNPALPEAIVDAFAFLVGVDAQEHEPDNADVPTPRAWVDEVDVDARAAIVPAADVIEDGAVRHWSYPVVALVGQLGAHMGSYSIAGRPWLTDELVEKCAADSYGYTRAGIAQRDDVDPRVLARLAADGSEIVRQNASANPRLSLHELLAMVEDPNEMVREGAALHPASSIARA